MVEMLGEVDSPNTKKQLKYAVNRLDSFARCAGTTLTTVEAYDMPELDKFLSRFYAGLRKDNGELYTRKSMLGFRYGIQRHFMELKKVDITSTDIFAESNRMYKAMLVKIKKCGKGAVKHKTPVSKEDWIKIWDSLDIGTPIGLQNKVFLDVMIYFANRGREGMRSMSITDFSVEVDDNLKLRYITHRDTLTKCRRENEDETVSGHMYEIPGSDRCPVASFLALRDVLNPDQPCMWQRPKDKAPEDGSAWYMKAPLGINTIGDKLKKISENAGCSRKYTNHSLRATTVTMLDAAGYPSRDIISITGHRSESSLKHYARTSDNQKLNMSRELATQMQETSNQSVELAMEPPAEQMMVTANRDEITMTETDGNNIVTVELTSSQEQVILNECQVINSAMTTSTSSTQHFHFNAPVTFYNKA